MCVCGGGGGGGVGGGGGERHGQGIVRAWPTGSGVCPHSAPGALRGQGPAALTLGRTWFTQRPLTYKEKLCTPWSFSCYLV